jgi:DNA repair and recombination protein RAD54B
MYRPGASIRRPRPLVAGAPPLAAGARPATGVRIAAGARPNAGASPTASALRSVNENKGNGIVPDGATSSSAAPSAPAPVRALHAKRHAKTAVASAIGKGKADACTAPSLTLYFGALYTKRSKKKNKVFQDGFILLRDDRYISLLNHVGKQIAKTSSTKPMGGLKEGNTLDINTFELEVTQPLEQADFDSGRIFLAAGAAALAGESSYAKPPADFPLATMGLGLSSTATTRRFKPPSCKKNQTVRGHGQSGLPEPLHNPDAPSAIVLQPSFIHHTGVTTVPIVMDPYLGKHLRPHQRAGIKYLYNCVEGMNKTREDNRGAVLADEMGLGKSLQSISLIWTVLKQGPLGTPVAQKAIVVCPASLVGNWVAEVKKWLGFERLSPIPVIPGSKTFAAQQAIADFIHGNIHRVLVISYEMFRSYADELYKCKCGIIICDEGHRLKSVQGNKTIDALMKMPCRRRVILTGTPVQNDLEEFFAMCNFVNPGAFGDLSAFRCIFANPILASRDANASDETARRGEARAKELNRVASKFVLRRTSETLEKYLPPKTETVIFCRLVEEQETIYIEQCGIGFAELRSSGSMGAAFSTINKLRKICCHPSMLAVADCEAESSASGSLTKRRTVRAQRSAFVDLQEGCGLDLTTPQVCDSGKLQVAMSICSASVASGDRMVLVSNFTTTLDMLQTALQDRDISYLRLDGSTPTNSRTDLVKQASMSFCSVQKPEESASI